jgi:hypothetical protein
VPDRGWKRAFDDPIPLPRGGELATFEDTGNYITKLPKAEHEAPCTDRHHAGAARCPLLPRNIKSVELNASASWLRDVQTRLPVH